MTLKRKTLTPAAGILLLAGALATVGQAGAVPVHARTKTAQAVKASTPPARPGLAGTITAISGNTLRVSLVPSHQSATVTLTAKTTYLVNGKSTTKQPTWKKGERIAISASKTKTGTYTATAITVGGPGRPGRPGGFGGPPAGRMAPVTGKIVSATTSTLVVKTSSGNTTFKLTSATQYLINGKASSKRPTLKAGEQVRVMGAGSGSALTARRVFIGTMPAPRFGSPPPGQ